MAVVTAHDFSDDVAFFLERLAWYDFVHEGKMADWDDWAWAVVDHEVLLARSALEMVRERLDDTALAMMSSADALWRAHPQAFAHMFKRAIAWIDPKSALDGWVRDEAGDVPPIPPSHWWWRLPKDW